MINIKKGIPLKQYNYRTDRKFYSDLSKALEIRGDKEKEISTTNEKFPVFPREVELTLRKLLSVLTNACQTLKIETTTSRLKSYETLHANINKRRP